MALLPVFRSDPLELVRGAAAVLMGGVEWGRPPSTGGLQAIVDASWRQAHLALSPRP